MTLWRRIYGERRRVLLPLVLAAAANVVLFTVVVLPLSRSVAGAEAQAQNAALNLAAARQLEPAATQSTRRPRKSLERGFVMRAGLLRQPTS